MCWESKKAERRVAKEDIKTFKVGIKGSGGNFCSYYYHHLYTPLQKYKVHMHSTFISGTLIVDVGFHSYNSKCCRVSLVDSVTPSRCDIVYDNKKNGVELLDWYSNRLNALLMAECIIPKGAEYYENKLGEIVSNQIIIESIKPIE